MSIQSSLKIFILALFLLLSAMTDLVAQGFHTEFGKSKVQYEKFEWYFYRTKNFEVYYHQGGKNLAIYVLTHGEELLREVEENLDFNLGKRVTVVIYNTYSDYKQSNITLEDEIYNTGGLTPIADNVAFVYFDGDHLQFEKKIKASFAEITLNELLYGSSVQQRVQNLALISLPDWYYYSLIKFMSKDWTIEDEEKLEDGIVSGRFKKFGKLDHNDKLLIGYSLWQYVHDRFGNGALANMIYFTHVNKNIDAGFNYVIGRSFKDVYADWFKTNQYKYLSKEVDGFQSPVVNIQDIAFPKKQQITQLSYSPQTGKVAFVGNKKGKARVYVYDLEKNKRKKVFRTGYSNYDFEDDMNYPLIQWHPREDKLAILYEKKSIPRILLYNEENKKKENKATLDKLDKILSFSFDNRGNSIALSGIKNGSSDIYMYQLRSARLFQITNDIYDDLQPHFIHNATALVFSSNRKELNLKSKVFNPETNFNPSFDIFYYDMKNKDRQVKQVTFTPEIDEFFPDGYNSTFLSYLTDENGIINRNAARLDSIFQKNKVVIAYHNKAKFKNDTFNFYENDLSTIFYTPKTYWDTVITLPDPDLLSQDTLILPDTQFVKKQAAILRIDTFSIYKDTAYSFRLTDYPYHIRQYQVLPRQSQVAELFYYDKKYRLSVSQLPQNPQQESMNRTAGNEIYNLLPVLEKNNEIISNNPFQFKKVIINEEKTDDQEDTFKYYFLNDYNIKEIIGHNEDSFSSFEYFKDLINNKETTFAREGNKPRSFKTKFGSSSGYFINFFPDYLVSQFDNSYLETPYLPYDGTLPITPFSKSTDAFIMAGINDVFKDFRMAGGFRLQANLQGAEYLLRFENLKSRLDKKFIFYRSSETTDLDASRIRHLTHQGRVQFNYPFYEYSSIRGELFIRQDRKITLSSEQATLHTPDEIHAYTGGKIEYVFDNTQTLSKNILQGTRFKAYFQNYRLLDNFKSEFSVYGFDYRNYIKIHKELIWANRIAFSSSIGGSKIVFMLGGVDNWLFAKINTDIQVDPDINYVYKSLAVNMRGFTQNIRNGNSYAVWNSEIRLPVFKYFSNKPLKSAFWESFQLIAFADAGTAWTGFNPYSKDNSLNKRIIDKNPFLITVTTVGEPIVGGYGVGMRGEIMGYFLRLDYAKGVEGGTVYDKIIYLSFGLDF